MAAKRPTLATPLTRLLGIETPVILAGMNGVSHSELAAAVTNGGGLGVSVLTMTPRCTRSPLAQGVPCRQERKGWWSIWPSRKSAAMQKTNHDYTHGHLPELIDIIVASGASLFVCAVGVPPRWVMDKLHAGGVVVANMVGHRQHVNKALSRRGHGHRARHRGWWSYGVSTLPLIPQCVDLVRGRKSPLNGQPVQVVAAGGIYDGRGVAAALSSGLLACGLMPGSSAPRSRQPATSIAMRSSRHSRLTRHGL